MSTSKPSSLEPFTTRLQDLLRRGEDIKPSGSIEPILNLDDLKDGIESIGLLAQGSGNKNYAAIETAVRSIFYNLLVILSWLFMDVRLTVA